MTATLLFYLAKVALAQFVFGLLYFVLFRKLQFFQGNRFYLLYIVLFAFAIPLIPFHADLTQSIAEIPGIELPIANVRSEITDLEQSTQSIVVLDKHSVETSEAFVPVDDVSRTTSATGLNWATVLGSIYGIGVFISLFFFIRRLQMLRKICANSRIGEVRGRRVHFHSGMPTSSFFQIIFWNSDEVDKNNEAFVLAHELVHCRQWHSLDNILLHLNSILLWFSPASFWLAKQVRLQHEFIADDLAFKKDSSLSYQTILTEHFKRFGKIESASPAVPFASMLKRRLAILAKPRQRVIHALKYLSVVPVLMGAVLLLSQENLRRAYGASVGNTDLLSYNPQLQLGDLVFQFSLEKSQGKDRFVCYSYHDYSTLRENWKYSFSVGQNSTQINTENGLSIKLAQTLDQYGINTIAEKSNFALNTSVNDVLPDLNELKNNQHVVVDGFFGEVPFKLLIQSVLTIEEPRISLIFKDQEFVMLASQHILPYVISKKDFQSLLRGYDDLRVGASVQTKQSTWLEYENETVPISIMKNGMLSLFDGGLRTLHNRELSRLLYRWDEIEKPIVVTLAGSDHQLYHVAFASSLSPMVSYQDLEEQYRSRLRIRHAQSHLIHKPMEVSWGALEVLAKWDHGPLSDRILIDGVLAEMNKVPISTVEEILLKKARARGTLEELNLEVHLSDPDRRMVLSTCTMGSDSQSCFQEMVSKLKPGYSLSARGIEDEDGNLLMQGFDLQIVEDL